MLGIPEVRTPREVTQEVTEFCNEVSPGTTPVYVKITPVSGYAPGECFDNVARQVVEHGGKIVYGFQIWYIPGKFIEAEHHAVWENPNGDLVCVTPRKDNEEKFLFLRDVSGIPFIPPVGNRRKAINESAIGVFLKERGDNAFEEQKKYYFGKGYAIPPEVMLMCDLAGLRVAVRESRKPGNDLPKAFVDFAKRAISAASNIPSKESKVRGRNDPCPCGSGQKYKKCHGK